MRKTIIVFVLFFVVGLLVACKANEKWEVVQTIDYTEIATWEPMETPVEDSGNGSVVETNETDGYVTIQAAADGWGGVQSGSITLDLSKNPLIMVRVYENPDGSKWGLKFLPDNPLEGHEWGFYLIEDNNFKWNKYGVVDVRDMLGETIIEAYGEKITGKLWLMAAGGPEAIVSISEIKIVNTK